MMPAGWKCGRRVGFLFPHPCERMDPIGCPDCQNGQIADPYRQRLDRGAYTGYDDYEGYDTSAGGVTDFTEADGESLVQPKDAFEDDLTAS